MDKKAKKVEAQGRLDFINDMTDRLWGGADESPADREAKDREAKARKERSVGLGPPASHKAPC